MTDDQRLYWVWLSQCKEIKPYTQRYLLKAYDRNPEIIYQEAKNGNLKLEVEADSSITEQIRKIPMKTESLDDAEKIISRCEANDIRIVTMADFNLPVPYQIMSDLPILLYVRGEEMTLKLGVGIVGPEKYTSDGKSSAIMLATDAAWEEHPVVSGMEKGIDSLALREALREDGIPVAVLGCGVDDCYRKDQSKLYEKILGKGVAVSEYPPGTKLTPEHLAKTNRIIASLSNDIYVVDAGKYNGTDLIAEAACRYHIPYEKWSF